MVRERQRKSDIEGIEQTSGFFSVDVVSIVDSGQVNEIVKPVALHTGTPACATAVAIGV